MSPELIQECMEAALCRLHSAEGEIASIQRMCEHPRVKKEHKASTGNWCPQDDTYWTEFKCPDCYKQWHEDGSK